MYVKSEHFAQGGRAVGHLSDGRIVLIDGLFPGEEGEIQITDTKKDYCLAKALNIAVPSPDRRLSPCPYSSACGGCQWIELNYNAQVRAKQELIQSLFQDIPNLKIEEPITGPEFGYRSRARFQYTNKNGSPNLGFCAENSNKTIKIDHCCVLDDSLNKLIQNPPRLNPWELKNQELSCITTDDGVLYDGKIGWITISGRRLPVSNSVFFQSNQILLPQLINYVVSLTEGPNVMDLYSGIGTFSAFLEDRFDVTAVEINKACLALAQKHLTRTHFFTSPVEKWKKRQRSVDTIIVDPPRTGLDKTVPSMLASWSPQRIIYVSCYAPTLHRDLLRFSMLGYTPKSLKFFDFYPNTSHCELVAYLTKS